MNKVIDEWGGPLVVLDDWGCCPCKNLWDLNHDDIKLKVVELREKINCRTVR